MFSIRTPYFEEPPGEAELRGEPTAPHVCVDTFLL